MSYLNTLPLVWGFLRGGQKGLFDLEFCLPSECADRLASGAADIGIVPSIELPRLGLEIIPGAGIACRSEVRSILLASKVPPERIRTLAGDASSRTSNVLAQIILARRYNTEPQVRLAAPDLDAMLARADAAVVIGDPALRIDRSAYPFRFFDLGVELTELTGLPMVFAVWAGRPGLGNGYLEEVFRQSCRYGLAHIDEIAREEAAPRGLKEDFAREYLTQNVVNELGEREYEGLRLFLKYAAEFAMVEPSGSITA